MPDYLEIKKTSRGNGLFAEGDFRFNEVIAKEENYYLGSRNKVGKFSIQVGDNLFLDHNNHPHYLDFINHSCSPNIGYDVELFLFYALRDIKLGEELVYDYETTEADLVINGEDFVCLCGSSNCRGNIIGFKKRKEEEQ
jgi:SET domain-containing protein